MVTIEIGKRVRFGPLTGAAPAGVAGSSMRPGELWEGVVEAVVPDAESGRERVTVRVEQLNGMRTDAVKEVYADAVSWEVL